MKRIFLASLLLLTASLFSQPSFGVWEKIETSDEFGDGTGSFVDRVLVEGVFNNSAVSNGEMIAKVIDYGDAISIYLYEYQRPPAAIVCHGGCSGEIVVKRENGEIEFHKAYSSSDGTLFFNENSSLLKLFRQFPGEKIKILVKEAKFNEYGSSSYFFEVTIPDLK